jgi:hypothetical protein
MTLYVNPENQKLLWNIINKHPKILGYFANKPPENKSYWFQSCIGFIYENIKYEDLNIDKLQYYNKETLKYMLNTIKEQHIESDLRNEMQYSRNIEQNLTKSELVNKSFSIRQKEYEDMIEKKTPESIDFRDKIDDEPISNMDEVLRTHLQMRENELKQYAPLPLVTDTNINNIITEKNIDNSITKNQEYDIEKSKMKNSVSLDDSEIEILKKQIRDLFKKIDKMQEEIDVLKYTKDIINNEYKNINISNTNGIV